MNNTKRAKVNKYGQLIGYFSELGSIHQFLKDEEGIFSKDENQTKNAACSRSNDRNRKRT